MYAKETMDNHWTLRLLRRWRYPALQFQRWIESRRTFSYEPVYYFRGGPVTVRALYRGLLQ